MLWRDRRLPRVYGRRGPGTEEEDTGFQLFKLIAPVTEPGAELDGDLVGLDDPSWSVRIGRAVIVASCPLGQTQEASEVEA